MACKSGVVAAVIAILLVGCKGSQPAAASSSGGEPSAAVGDGASAASVSSGGTRVESINDPSLNMNAISVTLPASWKFQSIFLQGGTCAPTPFGVFRAASPDGWSMVERMPSLAWQWGQGPMIGYMKKTDCLPMQSQIGAKDYLVYLAGTMNVHYDGTALVPTAEEEKAQQQLRDAQARYAPQYAASHLQQPKQTRDLARAMVSYKIGTTAMKGLLDVTVDCIESAYAGSPSLTAGSPGHPPQVVQGQASTVDKCVASTTYYTAPENQLAAVVQRWDAPGMGPKPIDAWFEAWVNRDNQQSQQRIGQIIREGEAQRAASAQQFAHSMAVQQQMHDQFMQTMQEGHEKFMAGQAQNMYARETATSDWVDFALDRQTVMNTNTGAIYKVTNQLTVEQPLTQVHGNGAPW